MWWWLRLGPKRLGNLSLSINVFTNMTVSMTESRLQLSMCFCACVFLCETNTVHHSYITQWRLVSFSWLKFRNKLVVTSALIHFCIAFIYLFLLDPPFRLSLIIWCIPLSSSPSPSPSPPLSDYTVTSHPANWWSSAVRPSSYTSCPFDFHPQTTKKRARIQST